MNAKITYAIVGIIAAIGLMTAATLSAANSAYAGVPISNKQECFKTYKDAYKSGQISKEQYIRDKKLCNSQF
jgi:hypothetical protein